jgi:hypothetical protein
VPNLLHFTNLRELVLTRNHFSGKLPDLSTLNATTLTTCQLMLASGETNAVCSDCLRAGPSQCFENVPICPNITCATTATTTTTTTVTTSSSAETTSSSAETISSSAETTSSSAETIVLTTKTTPNDTQAIVTTFLQASLFVPVLAISIGAGVCFVGERFLFCCARCACVLVVYVLTFAVQLCV